MIHLVIELFYANGDEHLLVSIHIKVFWNLGTLTFMNVVARDDRKIHRHTQTHTHTHTHTQTHTYTHKYTNTHTQQQIYTSSLNVIHIPDFIKIHYVTRTNALNITFEVLILSSSVGITKWIQAHIWGYNLLIKVSIASNVETFMTRAMKEYDSSGGLSACLIYNYQRKKIIAHDLRRSHSNNNFFRAHHLPQRKTKIWKT